MKIILQLNEFFDKGSLLERKPQQNQKATHPLYYYFIYGQNIIESLSNIYNISNNDLCLKRKFDLFQQIINHYGE